MTHPILRTGLAVSLALFLLTVFIPNIWKE